MGSMFGGYMPLLPNIAYMSMFQRASQQALPILPFSNMAAASLKPATLAFFEPQTQASAPVPTPAPVPTTTVQSASVLQPVVQEAPVLETPVQAPKPVVQPETQTPVEMMNEGVQLSFMDSLFENQAATAAAPNVDDKDPPAKRVKRDNKKAEMKALVSRLTELVDELSDLIQD